MNAEEYLNVIKEQIRDKRAKDYVARELQSHIEEQAEAFEMDGMSREEALEAAVKEMGDPVSVGERMDRIHRPHMEWRFLIYVAIISLMSIVFSALAGEAMGVAAPPRSHVAGILVGLAAMFVTYRMDYTVLAGKSRVLAGIFLILLCLLSVFSGRRVNGTPRTIAIGSFSVSAAALLLLYLPLFAAILYDLRGKGLSAALRILFWLAAPLLSRFICGDSPFSPYVALVLISELVLLIIALRRRWYAFKLREYFILGGSALAAFALALLTLLLNLQSYQAARLNFWLSNLGIVPRPVDVGGMDYVNSRLSLLFSQCRLFSGSEPALKLLNELPEQTGNFFLASVAASCGLMVAAGIVACLLLLAMYVFRLSLRQKNRLGHITVCSCGLVITVQTLMNVLIVLGLLPLSDSTLPFFSSGNSFIVVDYLLLGLTLSVYRYKDIRTETEVKIPCV